jgi:hypothetical protein
MTREKLIKKIDNRHVAAWGYSSVESLIAFH